jgi:O-antigen ligase
MPFPLRDIYKQFVFIGIFLYILIGIQPFKSLDSVSTFVDVEGSDALAMLFLMAIAFSLVVIFYFYERDVFEIYNHPYIYLCVLWYFVCTFFAVDKALSLKRFIVSIILTILFSLLFALPKNIHYFKVMLAVVVVIILTLCYFGVAVIPLNAIHQTIDRFEPQLAGDWRGIFQHKNVAGPLMCIFFICGLYFARALNRYFGWFICLLSAIFIVFSGAKTATALFLIAIIVAFMGLKFKSAFMRGLTLLSPMLMLLTFGVGSVLFKQIGQFNALFMKDATFTGRTKIWEFALARIPDYKNFGYGFYSFWNSSAIKFGNEDPEDWGGQLSQGHNSFLDTSLYSGYVGIVLTALFLVVLPLRDISTILKKHKSTDLTVLFVRIWVFLMAVSGMESFFFAKIEVLWFMLVFTVFSLRCLALFSVEE